jgi:uncharacterized protein (DUF1501 family)
LILSILGPARRLTLLGDLNMVSRRAFLKSSALVALTPTVPAFLAQTARAARPQKDGRVLVVIQLTGGNDGINTVVPFADEGYAKYRKTLRLPADKLLKVNKTVGLHPSLGGAAKLLESGRLAVLQGVGYPNPNRSHFQSMAIWHTARFKPGGQKEYGWLGRGLDGGRRPADGAPASLLVGLDSPPVALQGTRSVTGALDRLDDYVLTGEADLRTMIGKGKADSDLAAFVHRSMLDAYTASDRLKEAARAKDGGASYPATGLASRLRLIARLLKAGFGTRVYYTLQVGRGIADYDTHYAQLPAHASLLEELGGALRAFLDDLAAAKLAERVAVLTFSEFGRRVAENGSAGTDHGTAGPVFLAGPRVKPGLVGATPSLLDLQDGDLKMGIDFRRVYATVLEDWLGLPARTALNGTFERLALFQA